MSARDIFHVLIMILGVLFYKFSIFQAVTGKSTLWKIASYTIALSASVIRMRSDGFTLDVFFSFVIFFALNWMILKLSIKELGEK